MPVPWWPSWIKDSVYSIQAIPVHLTKIGDYLKSLTTDVSISKSFKLRRPSSTRMQFILSSFIWELRVFIVSFNHAFQLKIPLVIIFKIAYVAIESWTKYVLYFLTHRTLILLWPLPSLNKWIDQCCSLARAGAEIRLQHWGAGYGNMHAAARQTPISQRFSQVLTLWKMPCSQVLRFSTPRPETLYALKIVVM